MPEYQLIALALTISLIIFVFLLLAIIDINKRKDIWKNKTNYDEKIKKLKLENSKLKEENTNLKEKNEELEEILSVKINKEFEEDDSETKIIKLERKVKELKKALLIINNELVEKKEWVVRERNISPAKFVFRNVERENCGLGEDGKLIFWEDGEEYSVEEIGINYYKKEGYCAFWAENEYWKNLLYVLLYNEVIDGLEEIPYFENKREIDGRFEELYTLDLVEEVEKSFKENYDDLNIITDTFKKYALVDYLATPKYLDGDKLILLLQRFLKNEEHRYGLPDLIVYGKDGFFFSEVKSENDTVRDIQFNQHKYLVKIIGIKVELFCVNKSELQMKNLESKYENVVLEIFK